MVREYSRAGVIQLQNPMDLGDLFHLPLYRTLIEQTLAREVAILADRSDISEEIARLDAHLQQFRQICQTEGQAGRRLDFLSQEMLREVNTIGSKAADADIARSVVDIKCWIERLKEQIQNVE